MSRDYSGEFAEHIDPPDGGASLAAPDQRPVIRLTGGDLPTIVDAAEAALLDAGIDIYQRGGQLIRPVVEEMPGADDTTV
jgi:hypothetical protein